MMVSQIILFFSPLYETSWDGVGQWFENNFLIWFWLWLELVFCNSLTNTTPSVHRTRVLVFVSFRDASDYMIEMSHNKLFFIYFIIISFCCCCCWSKFHQEFNFLNLDSYQFLNFNFLHFRSSYFIKFSMNFITFRISSLFYNFVL